MYYITVPVQKYLGRENDPVENDNIDQAIENALGILGKEAKCPVVLTNVIPTVIPVLPYPRVFLTIMAMPYEPPIRFAGVHSAQDVFAQLKERR